jgi:hypothetical protein
MPGYEMKLTSCKRAHGLSIQKMNSMRSVVMIARVELQLLTTCAQPIQRNYVVTIALRESMSYMVNVSLTALYDA